MKTYEYGKSDIVLIQPVGKQRTFMDRKRGKGNT